MDGHTDSVSVGADSQMVTIKNKRKRYDKIMKPFSMYVSCTLNDGPRMS